MTEHDIQNQIRVAVSKYGLVFRANVGASRTPDGRYFDTGLPNGFPDLICVIRGLPPVFIEVKKQGGVLSEAQKHMHKALGAHGALVFVCRSAEEAKNNIIKELQQHEIFHKL